MSSRSRKFIRFRPITPASYHDANNYEFESVGQEFHTQGIFSPFLLSHNIGAFGFKDQSKSSGFNLDSGRINESRRSAEIPPSSSLSQYSRSYDIQSKKRKCSTIFLGGAEDRLGRNSGGFNPSCCPQMRCTSCNFAVLRFVGKLVYFHIIWLQSILRLYLNKTYSFWASIYYKSLFKANDGVEM